MANSNFAKKMRYSDRISTARLVSPLVMAIFEYRRLSLTYLQSPELRAQFRQSQVLPSPLRVQRWLRARRTRRMRARRSMPGGGDDDRRGRAGRRRYRIPVRAY